MEGWMEGLLGTDLCVFITGGITVITWGCVRAFKCETGQTIPPNLGSALYWLEIHLFCSLCKQINIPCLIFAFFHHTNLVSIHTVLCWTHGIYGTGGQECLHVHLSWWETHAAYCFGRTIYFFPDKNFAIWRGSGLIWLERGQRRRAFQAGSPVKAENE